MTTESNSTIQELAEIIADQNAQIRELQATCEEQDCIIVDYELDDEHQENEAASLYAELVDAMECSDSEHAAVLANILDCYFGDFHE